MVDTTLDPRENGFKPALLLTVMSYLTPAIFKHVSGSPPHARGAENSMGRSLQALGITPACAGSSYRWYLKCCHEWDHPRMRGEQFTRLAKPFRDQGSPPHARGAVMVVCLVSGLFRITPACAGSSLNFSLWLVGTRDHPRMRGEQGTG